jgi:hypothetical protein
MSEHHPEETMPVVACDLDCPDLPDGLIDELLAGARTPEEITEPGGAALSTDEAVGRAGDGGGAERASRLRAS